MRAVLIVVLMVSAAWSQTEVWLTAERRKALDRVVRQPRIIAVDRIRADQAVYTWSSGSSEWVTTQAVRRVAGAKAENVWQKKLDAEKAARKEIIDNIKALATKGSATKKELDALAAKTEKQQETKERQP